MQPRFKTRNLGKIEQRPEESVVDSFEGSVVRVGRNCCGSGGFYPNTEFNNGCFAGGNGLGFLPVLLLSVLCAGAIFGTGKEIRGNF
ncbi:MAG: hypothetical protein LBV12_12525 [Puniceicoccales bacterium]|nr:hypothetical protein [Puniceicoccales bacterium]